MPNPTPIPFAQAIAEILETAPSLAYKHAAAIAAMEQDDVITDLANPTPNPNTLRLILIYPLDDWLDFTDRWIAYRRHIGKPISSLTLAAALAAADHHRLTTATYTAQAHELLTNALQPS